MTPDAGAPPRLPPAYRLVSLDRVDSTNDEARRLADAGAAAGTIVWAREQAAGRGRRGRAWRSPPGNLYCSLVLRPPVALADAAQLSFVACLGVGDAIKSLVPASVPLRFKWPNDVLLDDRKVSGILLEAKAGRAVSEGAAGGTASGAASLDFVILGVGINVNSHPDDSETPATDLSAQGANGVSCAAVLEAFAEQFGLWCRRWIEEGFAPVRHAWLARAKGLGEVIRVRLEHATLEGRFGDLDPSGALLLELSGGGQRRIAAGDVFFTG